MVVMKMTHQEEIEQIRQKIENEILENVYFDYDAETNVIRETICLNIIDKYMKGESE